MYIKPPGARARRPGLPASPLTYRIIGVVSAVKRQEFTDDERPAFYGSDRQSGGVTHFLARTTGDLTSLLPALRQAIAEVEPEMVITASPGGPDSGAEGVARAPQLTR